MKNNDFRCHGGPSSLSDIAVQFAHHLTKQ